MIRHRCPVDALGLNAWITCEIGRTLHRFRHWARNASARPASASATSKGCCCPNTAQARSNGRARRPAAAARPRPQPRCRPGRRCTPAPGPSPRRCTASARSPMLPDSAFMPRSSLISRPSKPIAPRMTSAVTRGEMLAGRRRRWPRTPHARSWPPADRRRRRNVAKSVRSRSARDGRHHRQIQVAVLGRPPVSGHMLDHGQHAARHVALGDGASEIAHLAGLRAVGAIADDVVAAGHRHVEHRRAVGVDADGAQVGRGQSGRQSAPYGTPRRDRRA